MDSKVRTYNKYLKEMDKELFAQRDGRFINVYRYSPRSKSFGLSNGDVLTYYVKTINHILVLTDNWMYTGNPVDWGIEPLMRKLRAMDTWTRNGMIEDMELAREYRDKSKKREQRNIHESVAKEIRSEFKKGSDQINFANSKLKTNFKEGD